MKYAFHCACAVEYDTTLVIDAATEADAEAIARQVIRASNPVVYANAAYNPQPPPLPVTPHWELGGIGYHAIGRGPVMARPPYPDADPFFPWEEGDQRDHC